MPSCRISWDVQGLLRQAQEAIRQQEPPWRIVALLVRLARRAPRQSEPWLFAHRELAERTVTECPWRASLLIRRVLQRRSDDHGAWAVLGRAQRRLGNHRYAATAFRRALALAPGNPRYAYGLGRIYNETGQRSEEAVRLLRSAWEQLPDDTEVIVSYARALARTGEDSRAERLLNLVVQQGATAEQLALFHEVRARAEAGEQTPAAHREGLPHRRSRKRKHTSDRDP